jgi:small-conductance mechanosensitive channel
VDGGALPKVRHEFMKRIHRRFREEGIVFPYPTRSLQMEEDVRQRLVPPP